MIVKLLTEHHLEFLSFIEGGTGSSDSTHVKMPHCWKYHAAAQMLLLLTRLFDLLLQKYIKECYIKANRELQIWEKKLTVGQNYCYTSNLVTVNPV